MRHFLSSPLSWLCIGVCAGLLVACEGPGADGTSSFSLETASFAETDGLLGWPTQGRMLHGSSLESVSFTGASLNDLSISNLHLEKGELVGETSFIRTQTTPSLSACAGPTSGSTRSCGWDWRGVGTCTPQTSVHLGAAACGGLGSCTGDAMLRVCTGTAPCEFTAQLASSDDACNSLCPDVTFTCPASGTYNVLAGPYQSDASWSVQAVASSGQYPGRQVIRGTDLTGAKLKGTSSKAGIVSVDVYLMAISNAQDVRLDGSGAPWDATRDTFLYALKLIPRDSSWNPGPMEVCAPSGNNPTDPNQHWAVPLRGVYAEGTGTLDTSDATRFTFGCHNDVIAKCYRWGYKPWLDATANPPGQVATGHWACTRMARADYCGDGQTHTQDGTHIAFWDELKPATHARPDAGVIPPEMPFEAGWNVRGAVCLSHTRWATMPPPSANCPLVAPSYLVDGGTGVKCMPGQIVDEYKRKCATVCDTPEEALQYHPNDAVKVLNHSGLNGLDGGVADGG